MEQTLEYSASEAKAKFAELLDQVERGVTVQIVRRGKVVAKIVPEHVEAAMREQPERTGEAADAIRRLKELRDRVGKAPLDEILASRHEGHKY